VGFEAVVKRELARDWPGFRFAYSRPGFLTFKLPPHHGLEDDFDLRSVFARAYGFSLGKATGEDPDALAQAVWQVYGERPFDRLHVWQRDTAEPGDRGFEPGITPLAVEAEQAIRRHAPHSKAVARMPLGAKRPAARGEIVLDCIVVEPNQWWVGCHRVRSVSSRWPGGMLSLKLPENAVSRAWLKMEEALQWSQLPIPPGARCAEIGSSPGGASQALLARGFYVIGVDPAEMHPEVLAHPNFTHIRRRASQVRRREFRKIRWLMADMNVAPHYTLDVVESIVTYPEVNVRGMLLTLKLFHRELADRVPEYLQRVRSWGYNRVVAHQLQHNRQEICLSALMKPFVRKPPVR
jgi:23S rRNA (cytidine2498-2'-O)-methyltransferase